MVIVSPHNWGYALINGGDPNRLPTGMILQVGPPFFLDNYIGPIDLDLSTTSQFSRSFFV